MFAMTAIKGSKLSNVRLTKFNLIIGVICLLIPVASITVAKTITPETPQQVSTK